ncbi:MAG TPA: GNAT family N-acetyltransferase [Xanthomonadales bacterium]|nr:GNAT family N-acetyltransferase [Xanthomonadales bacterium]
MTEKTPLQVPQLETERLLIRRLRIEDTAAMLAILSDPETVRYWGRPAMTELQQAEAYTRENLRWMKDGHCLYWAIEEKASGQMIGTCTLFKLDINNRRGEIGYLLNRAYWHRGLMSEVLKSVIDYAFRELQLHRLEADTDPENAASIRLLENFGFQREGLFRDRWRVDGRWCDSLMMGLVHDSSHNAGANLAVGASLARD